MERKGKEHSYVPELKDSFLKGKISRREFIRNAALLGMSMGSLTTFLASCAPKPTPTPEPTSPPPTPAPAATPTPAPTATPTPVRPGMPKRGGVLRIAAIDVPGIDHPSRVATAAAKQPLRNILEYLTFTDADNVCHPFLLERWEASEDLKTWTLYLRREIKWSNGDDFNADDVVFTMKEWLDPEVGSSMRGLLSYLEPQNIEKVDKSTVRLHLNSPQIAVPQNLFHYPAMIINHRTFEGDILKAPVGTGPYNLEKWVLGERAEFKARDDYWQIGADNQPLPYLDEMKFVFIGEEETAFVAAFKAGQVDAYGQMPSQETAETLKQDPEASVETVVSGQTILIRMRMDVEPWTDNRVRMALKLCQDREKALAVCLKGEGVVGQDHHVGPVYPEYCPIETPKYDLERAKALLAEAGYPSGLDIELSTPSPTRFLSYSEVLKESAKPAGFRITLDVMPMSEYSARWTEYPVGLTSWGHRPLPTMVLALAYGCPEGKPVDWNETRFCDEEFQELLTEAQGTLDIEKRRQIMCKLEKIQQERGTIGNSFWMNRWAIIRRQFKNFKAHPADDYLYHEVWYDPEA